METNLTYKTGIRYKGFNVRKVTKIKKEIKKKHIIYICVMSTEKYS